MVIQPVDGKTRRWLNVWMRPDLVRYAFRTG
jgi:hypothetical protein